MADELTTKNLPRFEIMAKSAKDTFLSLADEKTWLSEIEFAMQTLRSNELLQKANPDSIRNAIVNVAMTGTTLNPAMAQAYLVPRDGKCCLDFSYRGLLKIATDSGGVKSIQASIVYSFDEFDYEEGTDQRVHFKRCMNPPEEFTKNPTASFWKYFVCAFSIAVLSDGMKDYMILPAWRIRKVKETSKAQGEYSPWAKWPDEMARKTILKYHYKTLPQTDRMSTAVSVLNEHEGIDIEADRKAARTSDMMDRFDKKPETHDADFTATDSGPDDPFTGSEDTFNELANMLKQAGESMSIETMNETWPIVNKQKANITSEQYQALFTLNKSIRAKIEAKAKGESNV